MAFTDLVFRSGETTITAEMMNMLVDELKAIENGLWETIYPVGAIYISTSSASPASFMGGSWEAFGQGRVLIGHGTGKDAENTERTFTAGSKGGSYAMPAHNHAIQEHTHQIVCASAGEHTHQVGNASNNAGSGSARKGAGSGGSISSSAAGSHSHSMECRSGGTGNTNNTGAGSSGNMQPYIVVYMYRRTA